VREAAEAALAAPHPADPPRAADVLLDAFALRFTQGYAAAVPALTRALELLVAADSSPGEARRWPWLVGAPSASGFIALELWDFESWHALIAGQAQFTRDTGAFVRLQFALNLPAAAHLLAGELAVAAEVLDEDRVIADATGNPPVALATMMVAAWRGQEREAAEAIEATTAAATARGVGGRLIDLADYASAVLSNGLGRHDAARDAARPAFEHDQLGLGPLIAPELAEAASRTGDTALVEAALEWLSERTRVTPTQWALGIQVGLRALPSQGEPAEQLYRESIDRLGRTRLRAELARAHLLYGEWLRRHNRRADAREQLRAAWQMLDAMGAGGFAERARRELLATGETVRKRSPQAAGVAGHALPPRRPRSRGWPARGCPTRRSARGCSSARARSSTTCARSSPSSASPPAASSTASSTPTRTPPGHAEADVSRPPWDEAACLPARQPGMRRQQRGR
jgi:hypothetical protein